MPRQPGPQHGENELRVRHPAPQDAVSDAYDRTLAQIHAWVVRAGIKTGMMALPTREQFLTSIGETGARWGGGGLPARWLDRLGERAW